MGAPNAALKEVPASPQDEWTNFDHPCLGINRIVDSEEGMVELLAPDGEIRKKFALIGFSTATRHMAPLNEPDWAVVGMNQLQRHLRHAVLDDDGKPIEGESMLRHGDLWFEIHKEWNTAVVPGTDHAGWLAECNIPVFMTDAVEEIPTSLPFPAERLIDKFGIDYFTSTVAYMFAWAIDHIDQLAEAQLRTAPGNGDASALDVLELARSVYSDYTIGVFGIDLIVGEEYCVAPETNVLTADLRWLPAGDLRPGDEVAAFDEYPQDDLVNRCWRRATVEATPKITRPCYRIIMEDDTEMVVSAEHRWLVAEGSLHQWRRTDELMEKPNRWGGKSPRRTPSKIVKPVDPWGGHIHAWDAGYLAAAFDGEGWLSGNTERRGSLGHLGFSQRANEMSRQVERSLRTYGYKWTKSDSATADCHQYRLRGGRHETMRFLGQIRPQRLLDKFDFENLGRMHSASKVPVRSCEYIGEQEVIGLKTSTGTFIAEGFASHNSHQRPCAEYWLGQAMARGIELMIPPQSALLKQHYRYGYHIESEGFIRASDFTTRRAQLDAEHKAAHDRAVELFGRLDELRNGPSGKKARAERETELVQAHQEASGKAVTLAGQVSELGYWAEFRNLRERGGTLG